MRVHPGEFLAGGAAVLLGMQGAILAHGVFEQQVEELPRGE